LSSISNTEPRLSDFRHRWASKYSKLKRLNDGRLRDQRKAIVISFRETDGLLFYHWCTAKIKALLDHFDNKSEESEVAPSTLWKQLSFFNGWAWKKRMFSCREKNRWETQLKITWFYAWTCYAMQKNWGSNWSFPNNSRPFLFASFKGGHKKQAKTKCANKWLVNWTYNIKKAKTFLSNICTFLIQVSASFNVTGYDFFCSSQRKQLIWRALTILNLHLISSSIIFSILVGIVAAWHFLHTSLRLLNI